MGSHIFESMASHWSNSLFLIFVACHCVKTLMAPCVLQEIERREVMNIEVYLKGIEGNRNIEI